MIMTSEENVDNFVSTFGGNAIMVVLKIIQLTKKRVSRKASHTRSLDFKGKLLCLKFPNLRLKKVVNLGS